MFKNQELFETAIALGSFRNWLEENHPLPDGVVVTIAPEYGMIRYKYQGLTTCNTKHNTAKIEINVSQDLDKVLMTYAHEYCHVLQFLAYHYKPQDFAVGDLCTKAEAWAFVQHKLYKEYRHEKRKNVPDRRHPRRDKHWQAEAI